MPSSGHKLQQLFGFGYLKTKMLALAITARSLIGMAHSMDLAVVAEGVEETVQLERLREFKCNQMQGYLISRPVPAENIIELSAQYGHDWASGLRESAC